MPYSKKQQVENMLKKEDNANNSNNKKGVVRGYP